MARTTRNSQAQIPPSASRPVSPYDPNNQPVPFPALDEEDFEVHDQQAATRRRRSPRQALSVRTDAPTTPPLVPVRAANRPKTPSHTPFRRPPTGSKAKRQALGDLMSPPPREPSPIEATPTEGEGEDEDDEHSTQSRLVPVPYSPRHDEDKHLKYTNAYDPFWKSERRPVHRAQRQQPDHWEEVGYYQENEWDTDAEEYTPRPPRQERRRNKPPKTGRDPAVLFDGESVQRNFKKLRPKTWKPFANPYVKSKLGFAPLNEGKKVMLVEDNGKAQYWQGVRTPMKQDTAPYWQGLMDAMDTKVLRLPEDGDVEFDENGDPQPNTDIDPSTGRPTAEWLEDQVDELVFEVERAERELNRLQGGKAELWGWLMMENEELEEDDRAVFELLKRVKRIVPPHVFKEMVFRMDRTDMDDPKNVYGPAEKIPHEGSSTDEGEEDTGGEGDSTDGEGDGTDGEDDGTDEGDDAEGGNDEDANALADMPARPQSTPHPANTNTNTNTTASGRETPNASPASATRVQSQLQPAALAATTSNPAHVGRGPKPLTRATYADKHALADALLAQLQPTPTASSSAERGSDGRKPKALTWKETAGPSSASGPKVGDREQTEDGNETDAEAPGGEDDGDEEGETEYDNKPRTVAFQVYTDPSSPQSGESDGGDADDEKESPVQARKRGKAQKENQGGVDDFDDIYADEEGTWNPPPPQTKGKGAGASEIKEEEAEEEGAGGAVVTVVDTGVKPVEAATSQAAAAFHVGVDGPVAGQKDAEEKKSSLEPKRMTSSLPTMSLKRDRDEGDEASECSDDEDENSWVPSKKRRVSGSYGAQDENTPVVSASQAETERKNEHETDESSSNRPSSPISEHPGSEEREDEEIKGILSYIESSPDGSPEPTGETSISAHVDWTGGDDDVEMSDGSDDEQDDENAAPVPPAPVPAPTPLPAPLLPSPVIVSTGAQGAGTPGDGGGASGSQGTVGVRRTRPLRRSETMWWGD